MKLWSRTRSDIPAAPKPRYPGVRAMLGAEDASSSLGPPAPVGAMLGASLSGERMTCRVDGPELVAMHTSLTAAAGSRLTCVVDLAARALTRQARSIHASHDAYHAIDDTGLFQLFARDLQETADLNLIAHRIAERALNPGLVAHDSSLMPGDLESWLRAEAELVAEYLGDPSDRIECPTSAQRLVFGNSRRRIPRMFDLDYPATLAATQNEDSYAQGVAGQRPFFLDHLAPLADEAFQEFTALTGRRYARASGHRLEDAEWVIVGQGSVMNDAEAIVDYLRAERGLKLGALNLTMFRPFPADLVTAMLSGRKGVLVLERADQPLAVDPPLLREIRAAMSRGLENGRHSMSHPGLFALRAFDVPEFYSACFGLGGRELGPGHLVAAVDNMLRGGEGVRQAYLGLDFVRPGTRLPKLQIWQESLLECYPQLKGLALTPAGAPDLLPKDAISVRVHSLGGSRADLAQKVGALGFELFGLHIKAWTRGAVSKTGQPQSALVVLSPTPVRSNAGPSRIDIVLAEDPNVFRYGDPFDGLAEGGALIVGTNLAPEELWRTLPIHARRVIVDRGLRVFGLAASTASESADAFLGAFLSIAPWRRSAEDDAALVSKAADLACLWKDGTTREQIESVLRRGLAAAQPLTPLSLERVDAKGDVPHRAALIESPRAEQGPAHEGRFWEQVCSLRELGQDGIADPFAALGVMPAATAAVRDFSGVRREVPDFLGARCTGCAECWTQCPDAAVPGLVNSVEDVLGAALEVASEGRPLERLRPIARHWAKETHKLLQKDQTLAPGLAFALAYDAVVGKMGLDADRRAAADAEFTLVQARLAEFPMARTKAFFDDFEAKARGEGGLLSITVNPEACKGCNLCVEVCPEKALVAAPQDEPMLQRVRRNWAMWTRLPDTDDRFSNPGDPATGEGPLATLLLKKRTYRSMTGGDSACLGCGEKTALHLVLSAIHGHLAPRVAKHVARLDQILEGLDGKARTLLAAGADLHAAAAAKGAVAVPVKEAERRRLELINRAADGLRELRWQYAEGPGGKGRALLGMANSDGCSSTFAGSYPYNPYPFPWVGQISSDSPSVALGLFDAHMSRMAAGFRAVRRAEKVLDDTYDAARDEPGLIALEWTQFTDEEFLLCPPILALGGDGAMLDRGLDGLSRVLDSGKPIRVVVLDTQGSSDASGRTTSGSFPGYRGKSEARKELVLLALAHRGVFVHQSSQASSAHLMSGVLKGLRTRHPAVFSLYAPCPQEHGFDGSASTRAARLALESRAFPFVTHDPDAGPTLAARLRLDGNPSLFSEWPVYTLRYLDEQNTEQSLDVPFTIADWAATEGRFKAHFAELPEAEWDDAVRFDSYLLLSGEERAGKTAFIHAVGADRRLRRLRVAPEIVWLADDRRAFFKELRQLAGLEVSGAARKTIEAEFEVRLAEARAEYEARVADLKREYPLQIARRLAEGLMEHGAGGALSELLSSLSTGAPASGHRPITTKTAEGPAPVAEPAAPTAPPVPAPPPPSPSAPAAKDDEPLALEAYIDSARCTSCNECINLNKKMFVYNAAKQAEIKDAAAGTFQQLVLAAERCPVSIIHPGSPLHPNEKDLEKWVKRAEKFN